MIVTRSIMPPSFSPFRPEGASHAHNGPGALGDFSIDWSVSHVFVLAAVVGALAAGVALALLDLIRLVTHLAYRGTFGVSLIAPDPGHLGALSAPRSGHRRCRDRHGLLGIKRIRGHGIPEAMETVLVEHSVKRASPS